MLERISYYTNHTLISSTIEATEVLSDATATIVRRVALDVIAHLGMIGMLFFLHHNLFAVGFAIGFICDKQVRELVEKVNAVYNVQRSSLEKLAFYGAGGFIAVYTMPTSIVVATLYYSAQCGTWLYQSSLARQMPLSHEPPNLVDPDSSAIIDTD